MARALTLALFVILANAAGNFALNWGMKHGGYLAGWTIAGVVLLIVWTVSRIRLLGIADLSYVLPITSIGYLIPLFLGVWWLGETISWQRWVGGALIVAGAGLVTPTPPKTA